MKHIKKKILPEYYIEVAEQRKTFEIRKDDSDYEVGDILELREWDGKKYTGRVVCRKITYILRNASKYGLKKGYCIIGIQPVNFGKFGGNIIKDDSGKIYATFSNKKQEERIYDQTHSYEDEPRYSPVERNICDCYTQTACYCGYCDSLVSFLQVRCEKCKHLIDWDNVIDNIRY